MTKPQTVKPAVLFVCLGNICRSPLAEAAFRAEAARAGLDAAADSAGLGSWHIGEPPDRRAQAVARAHGVDISGLRGRQVSVDDFTRFSHIVAADRENLAALRRMQPKEATAKLSLVLDHAPGRAGQAVADPYYGDASDFERAWAEVVAGAQGLVRQLKGEP